MLGGLLRRGAAAAVILAGTSGMLAGAHALAAGGGGGGAASKAHRAWPATFEPTLGDWEGTVDGFPASFQLVRASAYGVVGLAGYGYEDLTVLRPASCPLHRASYSEQIVAANAVIPLAAAGSLPLAATGLRGSLKGAHSATLATRAGARAAGRHAGCGGVLRWKMHPARRAPVLDGSWTLTFANAGSESFRVAAGGRLALGVGLPALPRRCGSPRGDVDLFIGASGSAVVSGGGIDVALRFTSPQSASGRMRFGRAGGCEVAVSAALAQTSP